MYRKHGLSKTKEYEAWQQMKNRCLNGAAKDYAKYGGRGIRICDRWLSFDLFIADMGRRPTDDHSIERCDNDGNYEPANCRWATWLEQQQNKQNTYFVTFRGTRMSFPDAWRSSSSLVSMSTARARFLRGWAIEEAFERELV